MDVCYSHVVWCGVMCGGCDSCVGAVKDPPTILYCTVLRCSVLPDDKAISALTHTIIPLPRITNGMSMSEQNRIEHVG